MSTLPKFELLRLFPTAVTVDVTETGGGGASVSNLSVVIVTTGGRFLSTTIGGSNSIMAQMVAALNASALNGTYAMSVSATTGKVTISVSGGSVTAFALSWDDLVFMADLGFTGNLSGAATYESTNQSKLVWLPDCNRVEGPVVTGTDTGWVLNNPSGATAIADGGQSFYHTYSTTYRTSFTFTHLKGHKVYSAHAVVTNEAASTFYDMLLSHGMVARYHHDRTSDSSYWTCRMLWPTFEPQGSGGSPPGAGAYHLNALQWDAIKYVT